MAVPGNAGTIHTHDTPAAGRRLRLTWDYRRKLWTIFRAT